MGSTIELPVWFVVLAGVLATIGLIDRLLAPSVRWFVRRRINRAIDELNHRLQLKMRPFGLTRRQILIDRLAFDPAVVAAAEQFAAENDMPVEVAMERTTRYAREIVPAFNAYVYFAIGTRIARWLSTALYRVRLGYSDEEGLSKVDPDSTVVFVINHRSNMDYVLVTYMAAASAALSYAVGEWARVAILQTLIRSMGAYFVRRNTRNVLYRRVLSRYVQMATEAGVTQAVFPEGGLSRDGKLRPVKLGLLSYIVAAHHAGSHDIVFIPVGLNYDRVLEDRTLVAENDPDAERSATPFRTTMAFLWKNLRLRLAGRWYRFGYACASFGTPVSLGDFLAGKGVSDFEAMNDDERMATISELGERLMTAIGAQIPALPVSLVSTVLLDAGSEGISMLSLKSGVGRLIDQLEAAGSHVHVPRHDRDYAVTAGIRMLEMRHIATLDDHGMYHIAANQRPLVAYYANAIGHLVSGEREVQPAPGS